MFTFFHWLLLLTTFILLGPILSQIPSYILIAKNNFFTAFFKSFNFEKNSYGEGIGNVTVFTVISMIFFLVLHNPFELGILPIIDDFLKDTLIINVENYRLVINAFNSVIYLLFIGFMMIIIFMSCALFYYSNNEKALAKGLYSRLAKFGTRNRNFETKSDYE